MKNIGIGIIVVGQVLNLVEYFKVSDNKKNKNNTVFVGQIG